MPVAAPQPAPMALPDRIVLPASYRLVILDGRPTLVRETDSEALRGAPASLRVVTGEIARGELAYQPGLLPQELAAEVAQGREAAARMDEALESVMRRSRELSEEAVRIEGEVRRLADSLKAAQAKAPQAPEPPQPN
jgi:hypothetical protein